MFTGLIEEVGRVVANRAAGRRRQLQISAPRICKSVRSCDSVAVNGFCLTFTSRARDQLAFDLLQETLNRTNLKKLGHGDLVNLERALRAGDRFGGHFVQGHVDCIAQILSFEKRGADHRLEIELPRRFAHYAPCFLHFRRKRLVDRRKRLFIFEVGLVRPRRFRSGLGRQRSDRRNTIAARTPAKHS